MKKMLFAVLSAGAMLLSGGCSIDMGQILEHPKQVAPSAQFEVSMVNQYLLVFNGATLSENVNRDSIHLAVGFPDGYSVVGAKCYFANSLNVLKLASKIDSAAAEQAIKDSAVVYKSRAVAMQASPSYTDVLRHRSYEAENADDTMSITVNTDLVKNWSAWGGKVNIAIAAGTPADTSMDTMGMSLGVISKSVFVWLTLKAKNTTGQDTLLYFSKTGSMPVSSDTENLDIGQITYAALKVTNSGVRLSDRLKNESSAISVMSCPGSDRIIIHFRAVYQDASGLEVFNASGIKVADLTSSIAGSNGSIAWSTKDGAPKPGMYILRLKSKKGNFSTTIRVL